MVKYILFLLNLIFSIIMVGFIYCMLNAWLFPFFNTTNCVCKPNVIDIIEVALALLTIIYTFREYQLHVDKNKAQVFENYNIRYEKNIKWQRIVEAISFCIEKKNYNTVSYSKKLEDRLRTEDQSRIDNNLELFMRFFEELEIQIRRKRIDEDVVRDVFAYYAVANSILLEKDTDLANRIYYASEKEDETWELYHRFVRRFKNLRKSILKKEVQ